MDSIIFCFCKNDGFCYEFANQIKLVFSQIKKNEDEFEINGLELNKKKTSSMKTGKRYERRCTRNNESSEPHTETLPILHIKTGLFLAIVQKRRTNAHRKKESTETVYSYTSYSQW